MKRSSSKKFIAVTATLLLLGISLTAKADSNQQLVRCYDTDLEAGAYGVYYGNTYHGTASVCGGDTLNRGSISLVNHRFLCVKLRRAQNGDPFILYEVYFVPIGGDPVTERVMVGNVITNCRGDADQYLKIMYKPNDRVRARKVNFKNLVGNSVAGNFFVYSRGHACFPANDSCPWTRCHAPDEWNTDDKSSRTTWHSGTELWGGNTNEFDGIQFVSGYASP